MSLEREIGSVMASKRQTPKRKPGEKPQCGLCGKTRKLIRTECCGQWICNDEEKYVMFSYARNSCSRNHRRYTLCAYHHGEQHPGNWKECPVCRKSFNTELYVWYGTNDCNFEKLDNPPSYEPTHCAKCGRRINLGEDGYSVLGDKYTCEECTEILMNEKTRRRERSS
jgi:hypothetical protein